MDSLNPPIGFHFKLTVDNQSYGFTEVSGLSPKLSVEELSDGGENRFKHRVPTSVKYDNLVVKRGLAPAQSGFVKWVNDTVDSNFDAPISPKNLTIALLNEQGNPVLSWSIINAWPVAYKMGAAVGENNEVTIESIAFSFNYFTMAASNKPE